MLWAGFRFVPLPASELVEVGGSMDLQRPGGKDRLKAILDAFKPDA